MRLIEGGEGRKMSKQTDSAETEYKRRHVLKQTAVATGGLAVGGAAISERATARRTGGKALTFGEDVGGFARLRRRSPFKILSEIQDVDFFASCKSDDSTVKSWTDFSIEYDDGAVSIMAVRTNKQVQVDNEYEFTAQPTQCPTFPGAVKTAFKPAL